MNQMSMAGLNVATAHFGGAAMMPNGSNGTMPRQGGELEETNYEAKLNSYIYGYFLDRKQWDMARALRNSGVPFNPAIDGINNGADDSKIHDTKNGIDTKRPDDLPEATGIENAQGGSFLLGWFSLFWDIYWAQRPGGQKNVLNRESIQYVNQSQVSHRLHRTRPYTYGLL